MPPPRLDLTLLPPHNWSKVLAEAWADKKKHSEEQWQRHATQLVHRAIMDRQSMFLAMAMAPLDYGWCRCIDGQIVVVRTWQAQDYEPTPDGYGCVDLADPPEPGELPIPLGFMDWPISWMEWAFAESVIEHGAAVGRYGQGHCKNQNFWGRLCYERYPNRWNQHLGDLLCAALYDWPQFPDEEAIAAYRTKHMQRAAPPQPNMLTLLAAQDQGGQCPNSSSHPKSKPSSPSQISSASSISAAAKTPSVPLSPSKTTTGAPRQLLIFDLLGQTRATSGTTTPKAAGSPASAGLSKDPPITASP